MTIKKLSLAEEREVILSLRGADSLGHGSSRVTYDLNPAIAARLDLDMSRDYVIKLAVGRGGLNQMALEINTFYYYGESGHLATIAAMGQFCEIMEKVSIIDDLECYPYEDFDSFIRGLNGFEDEDTNDNYTDVQKCEMWETHDFLNDQIGYTADNCQLGITVDGHAVAYDYGFDPNTEEDQLARSSDRVACDTGDYYIGRIAQVLDECVANGEERIGEDVLGEFMGSIDEEMWEY